MKKFKNIILFVLFAGQLFAQGGSVYTRFGIGDLRTPFSARRFSMGELGIALSDRDYLSFMNPAGLNELNLTRFETGIAYGGVNAQNSASSVYHSGVILNGMQTGFPIDREYGISFALGMVPYSEVNYDVETNQSDPLVNLHTAKYSGQGGISKFTAGGSYRLPFNFSLGVTYDYYFGRIENHSSVTFISDSTLSNASFYRETSYHGIGMTAGLITSDLSKLFGISDLREFRLGLVFTPSVTMSADSVDYLTSQVSTITTSTGSIKINLPYRLGFGAAFNLFNKYTISADYMYQPFSQYANNNVKFGYLQDYYKMSLGVEYRDLENRVDDFWKLVILRGGISYEQSQYKINGNGINQFSVYAGIAMPIGYQNTIDLGFQYGKRGTMDSNLLSENIFRFNVTLSLGELWFLRTDR